MLSHNLWSMAEQFRLLSQHETVTLTGREVALWQLVTEQCARDAEALEAQPAPLSQAERSDPRRVTRLRLPAGVARRHDHREGGR